MPFNFISLLHVIIAWGGRGLLPLVSLAVLSFLLHPLAYFSIKAGILWLTVPADDGMMVKRQWVDNHRNQSLSRVVLQVGWFPFAGGFEGPKGRDQA